MKPIKIIAALTATAILCITFVSCSKEPEEISPTFKFDYNTVVTNRTSEEYSESVTEISTGPEESEVTESELHNTTSREETVTLQPTTTAVTTTRKPYTFPTRPTTTTMPTTVPTTQTTTETTTVKITTTKPKVTAPIELPDKPGIAEPTPETPAE